MIGIEILRKELEGFEHSVEIGIEPNGEISARITSSVEAPNDVAITQELTNRLGIKARKLERDKSWRDSTVLRFEDKENKISVRGPWSNCKVIGYRTKVIPAKEE